MTDTIERSEIHATFVVERTYPVPMSAVWHVPTTCPSSSTATVM